MSLISYWILFFQTNAKFEAGRDDVRQAVRGEFTVAIDGLTTERSDLLNQMSDLRLKLAEAQSERDAAEKEWQVKAEDEAVKIHAKYVYMITFLLFFL